MFGTHRNYDFSIFLVLLGTSICLLLSSCVATGQMSSGKRLQRIEQSPNWKDGRFVNPLPRVEEGIWEAAWKFFFDKSDYSTPKEPVGIVKRHSTEFESTPVDNLLITWLGHSSVLLEVDGKRVLIDPVWSDRVSPFDWVGPKRFFESPLNLEDLPEINTVIISHDHYDHLDHRTIKLLGNKVDRYIVPLGIGAHLEYWGIEPGRIVELDWWEKHRENGIDFIATPARHFSGRSVFLSDLYQTLWCGWVIAGENQSIYYSGDTAMFSGFKEIGRRLGPFDAVLLDTGAYDKLWADVHLGPEQAIQARLDLGSGLLIPVHWATFDLALHGWTEPVERLLVASRTSGVDVAIPRPGESIDPESPAKVLRWWPNNPWRSADVAPVVSSGLEANRQLAVK